MKENTHLNRIEFSRKRAYNVFHYLGNSFDIKNEGIVKINLCHTKSGSILVPDFLLYKDKYWIQPINITVPLLGKYDDFIVADFYMDINCGKTIRIRIFNYNFIEELPDKSQLFKCEIYSDITNLDDYSCGEYKIIKDDYHLNLYHHTNDSSYNNIIKSKELWSSQWNIRGNKECKNFSYVYFTHIPFIEMNDDLIAIAMVNGNEIIIQVDGFQAPKILPPDWKEQFKDFIYIPDVYRSSTKDRKKSILFFIPITAIDKKHLYLHNQDDRIFYKVFQPHIYRIKLQLKQKLVFDDNFIIQNSKDIVFSNYSVIGDARYIDGLAAPFEEEETNFIFKQQDCSGKCILDFWFDNSNTVLFTGNISSFNIFG